MRPAWSMPSLSFLLVAACSDPAAPALDAAVPIDAGIAIDAPPAPVVVEVRTDLGPLAGVPVAFLDDHDAVLLDGVTDATGQLAAPVPAGGTVAALLTDTGSTTGYVWRDVAPGDHLQLYAGTGGAPTEVVTVNVPPTPGGAGFRVQSACGEGSDATTAVTLPYLAVPRCASQDLLVTDVGSGRALFAPAVAIGAGPVTLTGSYRAPTTRACAVTQLPAAATDAVAGCGLIADGAPVGDELVSTAPPQGARLDVSGPLPDVAGAALRTRAGYAVGRAQVSLWQVGAAPLDAAAVQPAAVTAGALTPTTATLALTLDAGTPPDGVVVTYSFPGPTVGRAGGTALYVLAAGADQVTVPPLPPAFDAVAIRLHPPVAFNATTFRHSAGLAAVRPRAFGVARPDALAAEAGALGLASFSPAQ